MVLLLGVDRFMSEARAITNTIGNAVGTMAIARWVGAMDVAKVRAVLDSGQPAAADVEAEGVPALAAQAVEVKLAPAVQGTA
jgi:Na+/H+-dicarboxylate symporter